MPRCGLCCGFQEGDRFVELADQYRAQIEAYIERRLREEHTLRRPGRAPSASEPGEA